MNLDALDLPRFAAPVRADDYRFGALGHAFPTIDFRERERAVTLGMPLSQYASYRDSLRRQHAAIAGPGRAYVATLRAWMVPGSDQTT